MAKSNARSTRQQSLGVLLLKVVFSIYMLVTIVITSAQMYSEYDFEKQSIEQNLATYQSIFGQAVATALWNLDEAQLIATLDGASELQDIAGILLYDTNNETIYHSGKAPETEVENTVARNSRQNLFYRSFKIDYRNKPIGSLFLYSSSDIVFAKVKNNFLFILINALIKSLVLWLLFLWAFKRFLVNALDQFIADMQNTDLDSLESSDKHTDRLYLRNSRELDSLHTVFESLKERLRQSKQNLQELNSNLEATIDRRTELLRRQQRVMESMSQQARIGAWEYNLDTGTMFWSSMTRSIFEVDSDFEPTQSKTLQFFDKENAELFQELEQRAIRKGTPWEVELQITTTSGQRIWIASTGESELRDGRCVRLFGSFQDIDAQIKTNQALVEAIQQAEEAAKTKDEFLASMSHEIRTPMNGIMGMLSVLLNSDLNETQSKQAKVALRSAESLLLLLDDLLDISRIESGNFSLNLANFDLGQLLHDQITLWQSRADAKQLSLTLDSSRLKVTSVFGDEHRLHQILSNLISNAIKFTDHGSVRVIASSSKKDTRHKVTIEVRDQGIGIEPIKQQAVFDSFVQVDNSSSRKHNGAGLGLSIVKELAELMGGSVHLESEYGKGSSFFITLFLDEAAEEESHQKPVPKQGHEPQPNSGSQLLVVEDNPINQMVVKAMLEQLGMACDLADDGQIALNMLKQNQHHYALIMMDCQMPNMDGYEATRAIRMGEAGESYRASPIVAMTANAMKGDREKCLKAGMDDYISKPVSAESLNDVVTRWIKKS